MWVSLLNFERSPRVSYLNFEGVPRSWVPGSQGSESRGSGPTFIPCITEQADFIWQEVDEPLSIYSSVVETIISLSRCIVVESMQICCF